MKNSAEFDARVYLHAMAGELAKIAKQNELETLGYLFEMAEHEAAGLGDPRSLFVRAPLDRR